MKETIFNDFFDALDRELERDRIEALIMIHRYVNSDILGYEVTDDKLDKLVLFIDQCFDRYMSDASVVRTLLVVTKSHRQNKDIKLFADKISGYFETEFNNGNKLA